MLKTKKKKFDIWKQVTFSSKSVLLQCFTLLNRFGFFLLQSKHMKATKSCCGENTL